MSKHARCGLASGTAVTHNLYLITLLVRIFVGATKSTHQNDGRVVCSPWQPAWEVSFTLEEHGPKGQEDAQCRAWETIMNRRWANCKSIQIEKDVLRKKNQIMKIQ